MEQRTDTKRLKLDDDDNGEKPQDQPYIITCVRERRARKYDVEEVAFRAKFNEKLFDDSTCRSGKRCTHSLANLNITSQAM